MKTIYSDKIGRNIHSPFVYKLVAHGLCAPYPFYAFAEIEKWGIGKKETKKLKTLFRLINFFSIEEVLLVGNIPETIATLSRLVRSDIKINQTALYYPSPIEDSVDGYRRLVMFGSVPETNCEYPSSPEIWLVDNLKEQSFQKFYSGLKFVEEARVTIEIRQMGIIIFNRIFEKQDYVIKP